MKTYGKELLAKYDSIDRESFITPPGGPEASELALLQLAIENESVLEDSSRRLSLSLDGAISDLQRAKKNVESRPEFLNSCGILQSLNTTIDNYVSQIKVRLEVRKMYMEALKLS